MNFTSALAQNLVSNPSFECGDDFCGPTQQALEYPVYACNWSCTNQGTSDLYSTLLPKECTCAMPNEGKFPPHIGTQSPRTGNRFAGIYTFSNYDIDHVSSTWHEYLQVELTEPLVIDQYYKVEFYVSLAEEAPLASNNIGVAFTEFHQFFDTYSVVPLTPVINETRIIKDTLHWVKIAKTFKATTQAAHMSIGNFFYDHQTSSVPLAWGNPKIPYAYYFIDDVSLEKIKCDTLSIVGNLEICEGDSTLLSVQSNYNSITWSTLKDGGEILGNDEAIWLTPKVTASYIFALKEGCPGLYQDTVTVVVDPLPTLDLGRDTVICAGTSLLLDAGANCANYRWQDNSVNQFYSVTTQGKYNVKITSLKDCINEDEIEVSLIHNPVIDLGRDTLICYDFFPLKAEPENENIYQWSSGETSQIINPTVAGNYWVNVQNRCGATIDTISIFSLKDIYIPNVLTLNLDSLNEQFKFKGIGSQSASCKLVIVDRWGKQVYRNDNYKQDWPPDDTIPSGIYYYQIDFINCSTYKGWLQILK